MFKKCHEKITSELTKRQINLLTVQIIIYETQDFSNLK